MLNAIQKYKRNNTQDFIDYMLAFEAADKFIKAEARARDVAQYDKKKWRAITQENTKEVEAK